MSRVERRKDAMGLPRYAQVNQKEATAAQQGWERVFRSKSKKQLRSERRKRGLQETGYDFQRLDLERRLPDAVSDILEPPIEESGPEPQELSVKQRENIHPIGYGIFIKAREVTSAIARRLHF